MPELILACQGIDFFLSSGPEVGDYVGRSYKRKGSDPAHIRDPGRSGK